MFLTWWLEQLSELAPSGLMQAAIRRSDATILEIHQGVVALKLREAGATVEIGRFSADEAGFQDIGRIIAAREGAPNPLLLRLPPDALLRKRLVLPIAAKRDLENLLGIEMDRETPFARDEVYWDFAVRQQDAATGRMTVDLFIAPRAYLDPIMTAAREAGLEPTGIEAETDDNQTTVVRVGEEKRWEWLRSDRRLVGMLAAAGALLLLVIATPFIRQQMAFAAADSTIDSLTTGAREAAALRQSVDQNSVAIDFLSKERVRTGSVLAALAATTRLLPDDSHLTALSLHAGRITITGLSPSAAHIVDLLAKSPDFREPAFDAAVVRNEQGGLETFTISATLTGAGGS